VKSTPTRNRAMTLTEVMIALTVLAIVMGGVFAALMQTRRLTEGSVVQNSALTIMQGYIEQMKNMELSQLVGGSDAKGNPVLNTGSFSIPTRLDDTHLDPLVTSTGSPPAITSITPGTTPSGLVDNLKNFDMIKDATDTNTVTDTSDSGSASTAQVAWNTVWPNATTYPTTQVGKTDLKMNVWVWVSDLSVSTTAQKVFGITLIYTWQYLDGGRIRYHMGSVRTVRSTVPTF
jgi:prepilin-type N-terminal cleavage/methylation domain-containing protein